ncbi:MAG: (Fe-S)-binding protein [Bacillota bacterium]
MAAILTLGIMGALFGLGLAYAAELLKVEPDPRVTGVEERLPGINCGACGYPGCSAFAEGIIEGEVKNLSQCKPGTDKHYNAILQYLKDHPNEDGSIINVAK